jgi:hypothetical protein
MRAGVLSAAISGMPPPRSSLLLLATIACASFQPVHTPVRDAAPQLTGHEVRVTDRFGLDRRLTDVRLQHDSLVGLSVADGRPVAIAADDVQRLEVLEGDPITTFLLQTGVFTLLIGAAAVLALVRVLAS